MLDGGELLLYVIISSLSRSTSFMVFNVTYTICIEPELNA